MLSTRIENVVVVSDETRLQKMKKKFNTLAQASFYMKSKKQAVNFERIQEEDTAMKSSLEMVNRRLNREVKTKLVTKDFLPNYIFSEKDMIVVVGQDGLVANTAKYAGGIPIVAVNPDPTRYDGILLPYTTENFIEAVERVIDGHFKSKRVTMAEAVLNDGQRLLAFNDLFIGPKTHSSARYILQHNQTREQQSSSGIIVSTGAGSTGWMSSVINMANGLYNVFGEQELSKVDRKTGRLLEVNNLLDPMRLAWDTNRLLFAVREPFLSRTTKVSLTAGIIEKDLALSIESLMPQEGVIFSDGIQQDYLEFTSGSIASIGIAKEQANLVIDA